MAKRLYSEERQRLRSLLKTLRLSKRITQSELSEKLGRYQSYVSDYERGHRRLDWVAVDEVVRACGESLMALARHYSARRVQWPVSG